nr:hypothetical protein [Polyangiaceae bacterium]
REQLLLREEQEEVALAVHLPAQGLDPGAPPLSLDVFCQIIEGVSHFIYLAARIRQNLPSTHLELELQAEVDKFALLALAPLLRGEGAMVWKIHSRLYEQASFLHEEGSVEGDRYRLATRLAARFSARLQGRLSSREATLRRLRAFHRAGQADKIHLALAA